MLMSGGVVRGQISSGIVVIKTPSVAADSIVTTHLSDTLCLGESTELVVAGGQLGTDARWTWYTGGCGMGSPVDTGASITVTPTGTLTYYCTAEGGCNAVVCRQLTLYVDLSPSCTPLPLHLLDFTAVLWGVNRAMTTWATADESDYSSFLLEKSTDGAAFKSLTMMPANGGPGNYNYQFIDPALATGRNFYRLKMLRRDGGYTYSPLRSVWYYPEQLNAGVLYPNPTDGKLYFEFESKQSGTVHTRIYSVLSGKVYEEQTNGYIKGKNTLRMDVTHLPDGAYLFLYDMDMSGTQRTIKFIKKAS